MVKQHWGLVLGVAGTLLAAALTAQARKPDQPSKQPSGLGLGNGAPALQVQEWLVGEPVMMPRSGRHGILLLVFSSTADTSTKKLLASLDQTQTKHQDAGVRIVVIPVEGDGADAKSLLDTDADLSLVVARDKAGSTARVYLGTANLDKVASRLPRAFLINHLGLIAWVGHPERGLYTPLHQTLAVAKDKQLLAQLRKTQGALGQAQGRRDYKTIESLTKELIAIGARHSSPWITRFRAYVDYKKDPQRAKEIAVAALKDLALRPAQMVHFANQCLLKDLDNRYYHQITLMALTPAAHQEPKNVAVQLAYARALAGCGNIKQASAVALRVVPLLGNNPGELQRYAEQLIDTRLPRTFAATALAAIDRAISLKGASRDLLMVKFRILDVGMSDLAAAHKVGEQIIGSMLNNNSSLNTLAWDLLTEEPYKGRFSSLALIATNAMQKNGQDITYYMLDTIALAKFENGFIDEAINLQKRAMAGGGKGDADYERRLTMYLKAKRERDKANRARQAKNKKQ